MIQDKNRGEGEFMRCFRRAFRVKPERLSEDELLALWGAIEATNKARMRRKVRRLSFVSTVCTAAAIVAVVFITLDVDKTESEREFAALFAPPAQLEPASEITLVVGDDKSVSFGGNEARIAYDGESITLNDNKIVTSRALDAASGEYLQIVVPKGKRSSVTLPEGTTVWLNAGSRLAFPKVFGKKNRRVCVEGEAYLEVSHDPRRPFTVATAAMAVEVLGTSFGVSAYGDAPSQNVVLVEGTVKVRRADSKESETVLAPDQMYSVSNGTVRVKRVDARRMVSWKDGLYQFHSQPMDEIARHLAHYYGVEIECSPAVAEMTFSGKLFLAENIETMLDGIARTAQVTCRHENNTYTISEKP